MALGISLCALLLERLLRLFNLLAETGSPFGVVLELAANLVPHYLGLALPAGFFIAVFVSVARLSEENELDAMLASRSEQHTSELQSLMRTTYAVVCLIKTSVSKKQIIRSTKCR